MNILCELFLCDNIAKRINVRFEKKHKKKLKLTEKKQN